MILIFVGATILWNSLVLKNTKIVLFYITSSVPICLFFARDPDTKIAENKQNSLTKKKVHSYIFGRNQNNILGGLLIF